LAASNSQALAEQACVKLVYCTAEKFWAAMCRADFVRTSRYTGKCAATVYFVLEAPEDVPGFIQGVCAETIRALDT